VINIASGMIIVEEEEEEEDDKLLNPRCEIPF
jgi:hypothetical protein